MSNKLLPPSFEAVLWDLDGTLVESEEYWLQTAEEILQNGGLAMTDGLRESLVGASAADSAAVLVQAGISSSEEQLVAQIVDGVADRLSASIEFRPGALGLLASIHSTGVPQAVVTMSWRCHVDIVLKAIPAPMRFEAVVAGDDVVHGKPHPEPYLRAAALLGVATTSCVAIEDSRVGVQSAVSSGAKTIGVPLHQELDHVGATTLWNSLRDRTASDLSAVFAEG